MRFRKNTRAVLLVLAICAPLLVGLAACGKRGNPEAPGPASQITYPKIYPTR